MRHEGDRLLRCWGPLRIGPAAGGGTQKARPACYILRMMWTRAETRLLDRLRTPLDVQRYLDQTPYSTDPIYRCPRRVMQDRRAHCVDGALFAAAALQHHGDPPLICWINAERDDGHLLALFRRDGLWGAVAKSNFVGLRFREPVYRSLRELLMSYFNDYFNAKGERSMRSYTRPLDLRRFDRLNWQTSREAMSPIIDDALDRLPVTRVAPASVIRRLGDVDPRTLAAGMLGTDKRGLFKP